VYEPGVPGSGKLTKRVFVPVTFCVSTHRLDTTGVPLKTSHLVDCHVPE